MNKEAINRVIDDVLYRRRVGSSSPSSSFAYNLAARDLAGMGSQVLPHIETVISREIFRASTISTDANALIAQFPGLLNLWIAYLSICKEDRVEHALEFLRRLRGPVLISAILSIGSVWRNELPASIAAWLGELAERSEEKTSSASRLALKRSHATTPA